MIDRNKKVLITLGIMAAGIFLSTGCASVAPYERAKLAHPTMAAGDIAGGHRRVSELRSLVRGHARAARRQEDPRSHDAESDEHLLVPVDHRVILRVG